MKVFIDTNVILEYLMQREHFSEAERALDYLQDGGHIMYMSVGGFYTILFIMEKFLKKEMRMEKQERTAKLRAVMSKLLDSFVVAEHNKDSLISAMADRGFTDLEDSCQYQLAERSGCNVLITFNMDDYIGVKHSAVNVMGPGSFMVMIQTKTFN